MMTFPICRWAEECGQQTAICWESGESALAKVIPAKITWQQWQKLVAQAAAWLVAQGADFSQLIAYKGEQKLLGVLCYCAVLAQGGRILILNPALTEIQQRQILQDNQVDLLLTEQHFANFSPNLTACDFPNIDPKRAATFTLTSGSSGKPKAVVHSIANHLDNAQGVCERLDFQQHHSWLLSLPLFHVSGQGIVWRWLYAGATLVISESKALFWQQLAQVSHASLVPTQLQRYLAAPNLATQPQHILLGGAFIPPHLILQAQQRGIHTYAGYGMTEMASTVCVAKHATDNVGTPLSGREVCVVDGEIWVRGAGLALGYWQNGEILPLTNSQGWLATKDCGEWNFNGQLIVRGRLDNMFISGGENIQPEEVEKCLFASGLVKNVLVVPIADAEFGERPAAFVEFHREFSPQAVESLKYFATQQLEKFKQPIIYLPFDSEKWQQNGVKVSRKLLKEFANRIG